MAIKRVAILMEVDTGEKDLASATCRVDALPGKFNKESLQIPGADETYLLMVNDSYNPGLPGKPNKYAMLTSAAHELGHVLSSVFKVPGGMHEDPRQCGEFADPLCAMFPSEEQNKRILENELSAWKIGKKIYPQLLSEQEDACLESYLENRSGKEPAQLAWDWLEKTKKAA